MSHREHREKAPVGIKVAIVTVSDTRTPETDASGKMIEEGLVRSGHSIVSTSIVKDDAKDIVAAAMTASALGSDVVIFTGGTGISSRDVTLEALRPLFAKELPGFGELFRILSHVEIGSASIMSRATAGITAARKLLVLLPGSTRAVSLAMERIVLPELGHLLEEARR
ncbi:MAG: MogA/MoaB family molybdenum cofactor biosynthesis protein [Euryarchaeota archaeon]|nr:MogA/MoaB family molybdenum cofactor biosynthesis protein [Euryarchaeota archaeon]